MNYDDMYNQISILKKNKSQMTLQERFKRIVSIVGEHPDAIHLFENWFLDSNQVRCLSGLNVDRYALTQSILQQSQIKTSNSSELTHKYYGFCKVITPQLMDQLIDAVATRIQMEREYAKVMDIHPSYDHQEEELTLNELSQFI